MKSGCCPSQSFSAFSRIVLANPVKKLKVFLFSPLGQSTHQASISSTWRRGMYILQLTGQQNDMIIVGPVVGLYVGKVGYSWKPESLGSSFHFTGSPWGAGPNTPTKCANFKGCHKKNQIQQTNPLVGVQTQCQKFGFFCQFFFLRNLLISCRILHRTKNTLSQFLL